MNLAGTVLWEDIKTRVHGKKERDKVGKQLERVCKHLGVVNTADALTDENDDSVILSNPLIGSFLWKQSPQGYDYWMHIYLGPRA